MKAFGLLSLALAAVCRAAPAPNSNYAAPGAVQPARIVSSSSAPATNKDPIAAQDVSFEAPVHKARAGTPDQSTPDNLYHVDISFSEYCDNGALKARGWLGNGQMSFELTLNPAQVTQIHLHPNFDLIAGPYSFDAHGFIMEYDGCKWTSEGGYPCGWCESKPWSLGPLNCHTGQPALQRLTYRTCYFVDNHMGGQSVGSKFELTASTSTIEDVKGVAARDVHHHIEDLKPPPIEPPTTTPIENIAFEMVSTTINSQASITNFVEPLTNGSNIVDAQGSTVVLMPAIIETRTPTTPETQNEIILPFHMEIWEYCINGKRLAAGVYYNGNMAQSLELKPGLMISLNHRVPDYENLIIGPFNYTASRLRFGYKDCEWFDDETWKSCGECRAGLWSGGPLNCADPRALRYKRMDCSVLLGIE